MVNAAVGACEARQVHPRTVVGYRTCIVVLGMHRSGTGALSRVLSILGAALPPRYEPRAWQRNRTLGAAKTRRFSR
jgi:hypothetical protein